MTKEKIIEVFSRKAKEIIIAEYKVDDRYIFTNQGKEAVADELLALFEQEKKEIVERKDRTMQQLLEVQKREIFRAVHYKLLGSGHSYLIKDLAKEYGVEL